MTKRSTTKSKTLSCNRNSRAFTVAQVGTNRLGAAAAITKKDAIELLMPDKGDVVQLFAVCAKDAGDARFLHANKRSKRIGQVKSK
jgi:hypothetical protein